MRDAARADAITAGLLALAVLPWLSSINESIEITGIGKLDLLEQRQATLQREIDALRFLVDGFVNDYEIAHLENLARDGSAHHKQGTTRNDRLSTRLSDGLISRS